MPAQEVELVADGALEAFGHVDVKVAERVGAHLGPARRVPRRLVDRGRWGDRVAVGDLEERRAGQVGGARERPVACGVEGAAGAELVAERRAGDGEEAGLGASAVVIAASEPGGPTTGTRSGSRPSAPRTASRTPSAVSRSSWPMPAERPISTSAARPSVAGTCEITAATRPSSAATRPSSAATAITWPPEYALPHRTMRSASTPGSPRA